jgi:flagellar hook-associated protein 3 FlgL
MAGLNRLNVDIERLSSSASSGKRLLKPADNPLGWAKSMDLKQGIRELGSFSKNIEFALHFGQATEDALNQLSELFVRAKEIAVGSINGTVNPEDTAYLKEMDQIFDEAVSAANQKYQGRYLFAVDSGRAPFDAAEANAVHADYPLAEGSDLEGTLTVRVGKSADQTVNVSGVETFLLDAGGEEKNSLQHLVSLKKAIEAHDTEAIEKEMGFIDIAIENFSKQTSQVGIRMSGLERRQSALDALEIEQTMRLSEVEDADLVEIVTQLQQKQTSFEAALRVTAMMDGMNLAHFL